MQDIGNKGEYKKTIEEVTLGFFQRPPNLKDPNERLKLSKTP